MVLSKQKYKLVFLIVFTILLFVILSFLFLVIGSEKISIINLFNAIFKYDNSDSHKFIRIVVLEIRMPRLIGNIIVGVSLSIAGSIMQGNTKNPMADTGIMGISSGSVLAIIVISIFLPSISKLSGIAVAFTGAFLATLLIYLIALMGKRSLSNERLILSGMAVSTLFSSITMIFVIKTGSLLTLSRYMAGSSSSTFWKDIIISIPFFAVGIIISIIISHSLTILNLGEEVSKGLGANVKLIKFLSTLSVLILTSVSVIIIGPVSYVGLMVPHITRFFVGGDYRKVIPISGIIGGILVLGADLIAKNILSPNEFPIGILLTILGVPFFIFVSNFQKNDYFK